MPGYIHAYIFIGRNVCLPTYIYIYMHTAHIHALIHMYIHKASYISVYTHVYIHKHIWKQMHMPHANLYKHIPTFRHAYIGTYIHDFSISGFPEVNISGSSIKSKSINTKIKIFQKSGNTEIPETQKS